MPSGCSAYESAALFPWGQKIPIGSGLDAVGRVARAIACGGVESMSCAPFVMPKVDTPFSRHAEVHDTPLGWRFVNPRRHDLHGADAMGETAENVAHEHGIALAIERVGSTASERQTPCLRGVFGGALAGAAHHRPGLLTRCDAKMPGSSKGAPINGGNVAQLVTRVTLWKGRVVDGRALPCRKDGWIFFRKRPQEPDR